MVVVGFDVEVVGIEVVVVEVEVVVSVLEVMRVVVLVGVLPGLTDVVVLELVVVLFVLWTATCLCNDEAASVGDLDLQLRYKIKIPEKIIMAMKK
jgi:hypothetical protein